MAWSPLTRDELRAIVARDLSNCSAEQRAYFEAVAIEPEKWMQSPWGDESGGFWAVAVDHDRVLWLNDYEEGFNVSRFTQRGTIPEDQYWCNQDPLHLALLELMTGNNPSGKWGPPQPITAIMTVLRRAAHALSHLVTRH